MGQQKSTAAEVPKVTRPLDSLPDLNVPEVTFIEHSGYISEGGDLMCTGMTISEAMHTAAKMYGCQGFCFRGALREGDVEVWFKNKCTSALCESADSWTSIQLLRDPPVPDPKPPAPDPEPDVTNVDQGEPDYEAQGALEFEAKGQANSGYDSQSFHVSVRSEQYLILTCIQENEFISCTRMSGGESVQLKVPDGSEPFGSWLLTAVKGSIGCHNGLLCLVDGEGTQLAKEEPPNRLTGDNSVCREISGATCVEQHFTTGRKEWLQHQAFADKPEGMKRLRELLSKEDSVLVESKSEEWANHFGIFSRTHTQVRGAGLVVNIWVETDKRTGA
jgi:hypothetical protein